VAYVPGGNDPASTTMEDRPGPRLTPHSCNLHGRCLRVAPDLVLVGCGGNASGWSERQRRTLADALRPVPAPLSTTDPAPRPPGVGADVVLAKDSVVLLTHSRPAAACGGERSEGEEEEGAEPLGALLRDDAAQRSVVVNVHAGAPWLTQPAEASQGAGEHESWGAGGEDAAELAGVGSVGNVRVVGGGSLAEGEFCLLTLARRERGQGRGWLLTRYQPMSVHNPC
jgi:hypothetical protein